MAAQKTFADFDFLGKYATRNRLEDPVSADPTGLGTQDEGRTWTNTTSHLRKWWNGTAVIDPLARANHSGSQLASTISDFDTQVRTSRLDQLAAPTADVSLGTHKITNLLDPTGAQDAATRNYVDTTLAGVASGQVTKGAVVVAATTNVSLSSPGGTIDGVTMSNPMTVLLAGQTTQADRGPYVWTGPSTPLTRAPNWSTSAQAVLGSYWVVEQGSHADSYALLTNDSTITLGTTALTFSFISGGTTYTGTSPIAVTGGAISIGLGTGLTTSGGNAVPDFTVVGRKVQGVIPTSTTGIVTISGAVVTINHGLGNYAPSITIAAYTSPYTGYTQGDLPIHGFVPTDANNVSGTLPAAPASNNWYYSIIA